MATAYEALGPTATVSDNEGNLYAGEFPRHESAIVVATGAGKLVRGTILGKLTAGGKAVAYDDAGTDGEAVAVGVLAVTIDATSGDVPTIMYTTGEFNRAACAGIDAAAEADLAPLNCYFRDMPGYVAPA